jgi:Skp family chaperone for outer membrane proteins
MKWNVFLKGALVASLVIAAAGCDNASKQSKGAAWVDVSQAISDSPLAEQEKTRLETVKNLLLKAEQEANKSYEGMDKAKADQARSSDAVTINRQWNLEQRAARVALLKEVRTAVEEVRKKNNYTVIVDGGAVLAADPASDVTKQVVESLKSAKVDFGELPTVTIKNEPDSK